MNRRRVVACAVLSWCVMSAMACGETRIINVVDGDSGLRFDAEVPDAKTEVDAAVSDTARDAAVFDASRDAEEASEADDDDAGAGVVDPGWDVGEDTWADTAPGYFDDATCDGQCTEGQVCARIEGHYQCIVCRNFEYESDSYPAYAVVIRNANDAAMLRGYRRFGSIEFATTEDVSTLLENLSCATIVEKLTVPATSNVDGLRSLRLVADATITLTHYVDDIVPNVNGLRSLTEVLGDLHLDTGNATDLHGLEQLVSVGGDFTLLTNEVTTLRDLSSLTNIDGSLVLSNGLIHELDFPQLAHVGGLVLTTASLTSLRGLPPPTTPYKELKLNQVALTSTAELVGLRRVTGDVWMYEDGGYQVPLDGLVDLEYVDGDFLKGTVCGPVHLPPGLRSVGGDLMFNQFWWIDGLSCEALDEGAVGFSNLEYVGGTLNFSMTGLKNLDGLEHLTHISGLTLRGNRSLERIDALSNVSGVLPGSILVVDTLLLTSLHGLEGITRVGEELTIARNEALETLDGLAGLQSVRDLNIADNPLLPACEASAAAERLMKICQCSGNDNDAVCVP